MAENNLQEKMKELAAQKRENAVLAGKPFHYGKVSQIHVFHALHQDHDYLSGRHIKDPTDEDLNQAIDDANQNGAPSIIIHGKVPSSLRGKAFPAKHPHFYAWPENSSDIAVEKTEADNPFKVLSDHFGQTYNKKSNLAFYEGLPPMNPSEACCCDSLSSAYQSLHDLAHIKTEEAISQQYGTGVRGKLGIITPREAKRAIHWEYLALEVQRELAKELKFEISDEDFAKDFNCVILDAMCRVLIGQMIDLSDKGFEPNAKIVPIEQCMQLIDDQAKARGLMHDEATTDSASIPKDIEDTFMQIKKGEGLAGPLLEGGKIRKFHLNRMEDESGISGSGRVAEGCVFSNGWATLNWLSRWGSVAFYPSIEALEKIHGHNGKTKIVFEDAPLEKAFKQSDGETMVNPQEHTSAINTVPQSLMDWGTNNLVPLQKDDIAVLELDGKTIKVRKLLEDLYSGWIEKDGQIIHQFDRLTMPIILSQIHSKLELYGREDQVVANEKEEPKVEMPLKELVEEHEKLVDALEKPTEEKLKEEAKEQGAELEAYKKKLNQSLAGITSKLKDLKNKLKVHVETINGKDLVEGIENPQQECPACERDAKDCVCYTGLPKPTIEVDGKKVTIFFKSEWNEEDRMNFMDDLKHRAGIIIEQDRILKSRIVLSHIRKKLGDK